MNLLTRLKEQIAAAEQKRIVLFFNIDRKLEIIGFDSKAEAQRKVDEVIEATDGDYECTVIKSRVHMDWRIPAKVHASRLQSCCIGVEDKVQYLRHHEKRLRKALGLTSKQFNEALGELT